MSMVASERTTFSMEMREDVTIAKFTKSRLDGGINPERLEHELSALAEKSACRKLVLDFSEVDGGASVAVGKAIPLHQKLRDSEGTLMLCGLGNSVRGVLRETGLVKYFNIADDVETALDILK